MDIKVSAVSPAKQRTTCIVVGVHAGRRLCPSAESLDKASKGAISKHLRQHAMSGRANQRLLLHDLPGIAADRVLLIGGGKHDESTLKTYQSAVTTAFRELCASGAKQAVVALNEFEVDGADAYAKARHCVEAVRRAAYRFDQLKGENNKAEPIVLKRLTLAAGSGARNKTDTERGVAHGLAIANGADLARDLGNLPGNVCTPTYLADRAKQLGRKHKSLSVRVRGESEMKRLGMGSFLSVAQGSREPAKFIALEYRGGKANAKPVVLVGKGVTFDTGGISLKPPGTMDEMKFDMCGAASVLGTMQCVTELKLKLNVVGLIPATENMPGGPATKPGDIVTSMSGRTIEILNTDAEGRLILCDALTFAKRYKPDAVVDIATLTGAMVVALGSHATGMFSNDDALAAELVGAGETSADRVWRMPLWDDYDAQLKSNFADMANIGGRQAGSVTAACFLARFCKSFRWAHLDIAGTAWKSGREKGATARPVMLLSQFLIDRAAGKKRG